jgi:dolichol-phosphate mannosyltransferase
VTEPFANQYWQVPEFRQKVFFTKHRAYCVVIPVINEGERIRRLLRSMNELRVAEQADILLIDGGSTDGSLDEEFLRSVGVRALLTKTGPGKLSAQLRCAYAYALREGYDGIVTIDGNDKDDPSTIPDFIRGLEEGWDFLQASRFIPGGLAENTPLTRWIAIRMVHAPMLSLFSGFKWTDTTQGYRAYSRQMLLDPQIQPFRDIFMRYELLAYLSYRVPRLKYRVKELPTTRRYPRDEAIPTKISTFRGNWDVMKTLFAACFGKFNPK